MKRMLPVLCLLLAACVAPPAAAPTDVPATAAPTEPPFVPTDAPAGAEPTAAPVPTVAGTLPLEALAPERIEFAAEDGTPLVGTYFPPTQPEAPGVVLVHMLNRSREDWLTNRVAIMLQGVAVADASVEGRSYAVLTVDLRGHGESGGERDRSAYPMDVVAALNALQQMDAVDPENIALVGASIGADSVVSACGEGCVGAVSISPGGFTGTPYDQALGALGDKPVLCVAAENDAPSPAACESGRGVGLSNYVYQEYEGGAHGTALFEADVEPSLLTVLIEWLDAHLTQ